MRAPCIHGLVLVLEMSFFHLHFRDNVTMSDQTIVLSLQLEECRKNTSYHSRKFSLLKS